MTKEEREKAIDVLEHNWTRVINPDYTEEETNKALNRAIEALSEESKIDKIIAEIEDGRLQAVCLLNKPYEGKKGSLDDWKKYERDKRELGLMCEVMQGCIDIINKYREEKR